MIKIQNKDCVDFLQSFDNHSVDLVITDPPYGVLKTDHCSWDKTSLNWTQIGTEIFRVLKPGGQVFLFSSWQLWFHLMQIDVWKSRFYYEVILNRKVTFAAPYKKRPANIHEYGLVFRGGNTPVYFDEEPLGIIKQPYTKKNIDTTNRTSAMDTIGVRSNSTGRRKPVSIIETRRKACMEKKYRTNHPTQKDHETIRKLILTMTPPGALIVDPFSGSASTGLATMLAGGHRRCFLGEISHEYHTQAIGRLKNFARSDRQGIICT